MSEHENISVRVRVNECVGECMLGSIPSGGIPVGYAGRVLQFRLVYDA